MGDFAIPDRVALSQALQSRGASVAEFSRYCVEPLSSLSVASLDAQIERCPRKFFTFGIVMLQLVIVDVRSELLVISNEDSMFHSRQECCKRLRL
jgi:hypothetical protein